MLFWHWRTFVVSVNQLIPELVYIARLIYHRLKELGYDMRELPPAPWPASVRIDALDFIKLFRPHAPAPLRPSVLAAAPTVRSPEPIKRTAVVTPESLLREGRYPFNHDMPGTRFSSDSGAGSSYNDGGSRCSGVDHGLSACADLADDNGDDFGGVEGDSGGVGGDDSGDGGEVRASNAGSLHVEDAGDGDGDGGVVQKVPGAVKAAGAPRRIQTTGAVLKRELFSSGVRKVNVDGKGQCMFEAAGVAAGLGGGPKVISELREQVGNGWIKLGKSFHTALVGKTGKGHSLGGFAILDNGVFTWPGFDPAQGSLPSAASALDAPGSATEPLRRWLRDAGFAERRLLRELNPRTTKDNYPLDVNHALWDRVTRGVKLVSEFGPRQLNKPGLILATGLDVLFTVVFCLTRALTNFEYKDSGSVLSIFGWADTAEVALLALERQCLIVQIQPGLSMVEVRWWAYDEATYKGLDELAQLEPRRFYITDVSKHLGILGKFKAKYPSVVLVFFDTNHFQALVPCENGALMVRPLPSAQPLSNSSASASAAGCSASSGSANTGAVRADCQRISGLGNAPFPHPSGGVSEVVAEGLYAEAEKAKRTYVAFCTARGFLPRPLPALVGDADDTAAVSQLALRQEFAGFSRSGASPALLAAFNELDLSPEMTEERFQEVVRAFCGSLSDSCIEAFDESGSSGGGGGGGALAEGGYSGRRELWSGSGATRSIATASDEGDTALQWNLFDPAIDLDEGEIQALAETRSHKDPTPDPDPALPKVKHPSSPAFCVLLTLLRIPQRSSQVWTFDEERALGAAVGILSAADLLQFEPGSLTPSWRVPPSPGTGGLFAFLGSLRTLQDFSPEEIKAKAAFLEHSRRAAINQALEVQGPRDLQPAFTGPGAPVQSLAPTHARNDEVFGGSPRRNASGAVETAFNCRDDERTMTPQALHQQLLELEDGGGGPSPLIASAGHACQGGDSGFYNRRDDDYGSDASRGEDSEDDFEARARFDFHAIADAEYQNLFHELEDGDDGPSPLIASAGHAFQGGDSGYDDRRDDNSGNDAVCQARARFDDEKAGLEHACTDLQARDNADQNDNDKDELRELLAEYSASPPLSCTYKQASACAVQSSAPRAPLTSAHLLHDPEMQRLLAEYWAAPALGSSHSSYGL
jgi:hypothetical protein